MFASTVKRLLSKPLTKSHVEDTITTGLLKESPVEIELPEYQRLPDIDVESPSDLLRGETSSVGLISDLDHFFERLYNYYCEKGFWCMVTRWIVELLCLAFTIVFSFIFLLCVDWHALRTVNCGRNSKEPVGFNCDLDRVVFHKNPFRPITFFTGVVIVYLGLFSMYWVFCFLRFFAQLKDTLEIRDFYSNSLKISDREIQTLSWSFILDKTVQFQRIHRLCVVKDLSAHDIVMRIMRKDNYLIGMLNKGVLAIPIPKWVPGTGPVANCKDGVKNYLILTKTLEWSVNWCILQYMFDRKFSIRREFITNPELLRKRLTAFGLTMFLLSPFLIIFMLVYFFLRHAEHFYNHPNTVASRRWSNLSLWLFREFNELDHLFRHRLNAGTKYANDYMQQFPSPILSLVAKLVSFVSGGFAAILLIIACLDESLLEAHLYGRNLIWYAAIFGTIAAISRALIADEFQPFDPQGTMALVCHFTHYMPKNWRGKEASELVQREFGALFQYTGLMLVEEMVSIFATPYILLFLLPQRVDDILQFIEQFTVNVEGVGDVCSLSLFDFHAHGNIKYGSPFQTSKERRSCQGKMEKSFLSFKNSYPSWEPDAQGKQFLSTLMDFRQQEWDRQESEMYLQRSTAFRGSFISGSREGLVNRWSSPRSRRVDNLFKNLEPLRTLEREQESHLYWLDKYYMLQSSNGFESKDNHVNSSPLEYDWLRSGETHSVPQLSIRNRSPCHQKDRMPVLERLESHMQASTSDTCFQNDTIQQEMPGQQDSMRNRWWARPRTSSMNAGSFLEPPNACEISHLEEPIDNAFYYADREESMEMKESSFRYEGHTDLRETILEIDQSNADISNAFDEVPAFDLPFDIYDHPEHPSRHTFRDDSSQDTVH